MRSYTESGPNGMKILRVQRRGQGARRVDLARDLDRLVHQGGRRGDVVVNPVQLGRLGRQQRCPARRSLGSDRLQRLVEQGEQVLVHSAGVGHHRDADGGADQAVVVAEGSRRGCGPLEGRARVGHPRRLGLRAAQRQQEPAAQGLVGLLAELERLERPRVDLDRVLVGELLHVLRAGPLGVVDRRGEVAARRSGQEVVGELAEALGGVAPRRSPPAPGRSARAAPSAAPGSAPRRGCRGPARGRTSSARRPGR